MREYSVGKAPKKFHSSSIQFEAIVLLTFIC